MLGALPDPVVKATLSEILDGTTASQLHSMKSNNYDDLTTIMKYTGDAGQQVRQLAQRALAANSAARTSIQQAIAQYSSIVSYIETAFRSLGRSDYPPQLSGMGSMGILGIDDLFTAMVAVGVATAVIAGIYAMIALINTARGHIDTSHSFMDQFTGIVDAATRAIKAAGDAALQGSSALTTVAIIGAIGVAAYFAWPKAKQYFGR
ncbi:MAG: hypothetical protein GZ088_09665 [Acidipila sp.]|nr:hypothetical protein [Acidipila sp.]